ncbi:hypothetical protein [Bradyrhizobium sp.]|uniref:hypothetical protein n=1 Tax=Bradyrhizobium sp. TaxID=376 RepID=UPI003C7120B6
MFYRTFLRGIFGVLWCAVLQPNQLAAAAQNDPANFLKTMQKIVKENGDLLFILLRHHKRYCWDGTDPDETVMVEYKQVVAALTVLETDNRIISQANRMAPSLDSYIEYRLSIADTALKSNCLNMADEQYRAVLKDFSQINHGRYRELAKIGVDDVREKRVAQAAADQKHSGPSSVPWELVGEWLPQSGDLVPKDIGKCKPTSPNDSGPFVLKTDGSWDRSFPNAATSHCVLSLAPFFSEGKDWKVTSTCQPQVTEVWWQLGSARDRITTHDFIDNTATGGKKSIGSTKVEYRRCD